MDTSVAKIFTTFLRSLPWLARLGANLTIIYLTLGWQVRKARKAFEKELISQGMPKKNAKRLSETFVHLKNDIIDMVKRSAFSR
ncbi:MAG: hypothetical protein QXN63_02470 [Candidatus Bathyarchaeia archaeon]